MFAAHEVAVHIVQYFIAVYVAVVVGCGNGLRVVIVEARHEGADDEIAPVESLVYRWRLVYAAGDRLELMDGEGVGIDVAVPADDIERVVEVVIGIDDVLFFDVKQELALLVVRGEVLGLANVALAEWRVLLELPDGVAVAFGRYDGAERFDDEEAVVGGVEMQLVGGAARNDDIIAVLEGQFAVHGEELAGAFVDEDHFVGIGIFEEVAGHALARRGEDDAAVVVDEYGLAGGEVVVFRLDAEPLEAAVFELFVVYGFGRYGVRFAGLHDLGGRIAMVQNGVGIAEALGREQLFVVEAAVGLAELDVPLVWYLAKAVVVHI